jgi:hypothetical protein
VIIVLPSFGSEGLEEIKSVLGRLLKKANLVK